MRYPLPPHIVLILMLLCAMLTSCDTDSVIGSRPEVIPPPSPVDRTVLVYMVARNDMGLNGKDEDDLAEMASVTLPPMSRLIVYRSRHDEAPELMELTDGRFTVLKTYDTHLPSVSVERMRQVIGDTRALAPASSSGIVLWSHSFGWQQTLTRNSRSFGYEGGRTMSVTDLAEALAGQRLDFIFFDSCFMGSVEVAYELRGCAARMVGSMCEVPYDGMPYHLTLPALFDTDIDAGLRRAIDLNVDYYIERRESCPATFALINLRAMDELAEETARVYDAGLTLPDGYTPRPLALPSSQYCDRFFDFAHYVRALAAGSGAPLEAWERALERAVTHERHSSRIWDRIDLDGVCGLSTFFPHDRYDYSAYGYSSLSWPQATIPESTLTTIPAQ